MAPALEDQVAIVTGGSSGIGRATCRVLARAGAHVVAVGRNAGRLGETLAALRPDNERHSTRALALALDVTSEVDTRQLAARTLETFGRIDILICAAGIVRPPDSRLQTVAQTPLADFQTVLDTNLKGVFLCCRAVLPAMIAQGGGDIVNVGSTSGLSGIAFDGAYCASKFAVIGLSEALAEEAAPDGVRVQTLLPGPFETEMWQRTPSGLRPGNALPPGERVADTILYLLGLPHDTRLVAPVVQPVALELGSSVLGGSGAGKGARSSPTAEETHGALTPAGRLRGKVVIVTGGAAGFGLAAAQTVASEEAHVVLADNDTERVRQATASLPGPGHTGLALDLADDNDSATLIRTTLERFGRLDALVTTSDTAAAATPQPVVDTSVSDWDAVLARTLKQVYLANRAAVPVLVKQRGGVIVNVASTAALKGRANEGALCAAQFGILGLTQTLADEVRASGVRVQTLLPAAQPSTPAVANALIYLLAQPPDTVTPAALIAPLGARRRRGKPGENG